MDPTTRKRILLVGAYERDNFGDILFAIITRSHLLDRGHEVVLSSMIYSDMRHIFGEVIYPYDAMLSSFRFDVVWVVGGEVGSADIRGAMRLTLEPSTSLLYSPDSGESDRYALQGGLGAPVRNELAYIPNLNRYPLNDGVLLILNSVGGFRRNRMSDYVAQAGRNSYVSVRDKVSFQHLDAESFSGQTLSPDLVHTLPMKHGVETRVGPYVVFQISQAIAEVSDLSVLVSELIDIASVHRIGIRILSAGDAPGHDSQYFYNTLIAAMGRHRSSIEVSIIEEREPLAIVDIIASSRAWIGSSLHGRIVAAAYGVPRVSLDKPKVNQYAEFWDNRMPHGVKIGQISIALSSAFALSDSDSAGQKLAGLAMDNLELLVSNMEREPRRSDTEPLNVQRISTATLNHLRKFAEDQFRRNSL